ncbi:MAG TPA: hypothetical protein VMF67_07195 [Rhizomicrobium sp.]|nr:hypothetical protein [Rhizomicrobium sp.]
MKIKNCLTAGVSALAVTAFAAAITGVSAHVIYLPYRPGMTAPKPITPAAQPYRAPYVAPKKSKSGTWTDLTNNPFTSEGGWGPMQLTDGTLLVKEAFTGTAGIWYKLTPDKKGQYTDGTFTKIATMPSGYSPDFFAQQVLPNGNVLIEGGEYNDQQGDWSNKGAIYNPVANTWASVTPPSGWGSIGDSESVILPDGTYMLGDCCEFGTGQQVLATVSGTTVNWAKPTNTWTCNKVEDDYPCMDEEGFTSLPNGNVFLVDVWDYTSTSDEYWIYDTSTGAWSQPGSTPNRLSDTSYFELGAAPLTPQSGKQGTIIQLTADVDSPGPSDVYNVAKGKWSTGPTLKVGSTIYVMADAPAAVLPDGNVLAEASPYYGSPGPAHFWEMKTSKKGKVTATQVNDTKTSAQSNCFTGNLIPLPTGQIFWDNSQYSTELAIYTPQGTAKPAWAPVVSSVSSTLTVGSTANAISGTNFNGFTTGGYYGDDAQAATNYPLVRITNNSTGDVCFGRSYNFSTMGVWTTGTTNAVFDIPSTCETGASTLTVVVNGITSAGVSVTLNS